MKGKGEGEKEDRAVVVVVIVVVAWYDASCLVVRVLVTAVAQTTGTIVARLGPITNAFVSGGSGGASSGSSDNDVIVVVVAGELFQSSSERTR